MVFLLLITLYHIPKYIFFFSNNFLLNIQNLFLCLIFLSFQLLHFYKIIQYFLIGIQRIPTPRIQHQMNLLPPNSRFTSRLSNPLISPSKIHTFNILSHLTDLIFIPPQSRTIKFRFFYFFSKKLNRCKIFLYTLNSIKCDLSHITHIPHWVSFQASGFLSKKKSTANTTYIRRLYYFQLFLIRRLIHQSFRLHFQLFLILTLIHQSFPFHFQLVFLFKQILFKFSVNINMTSQILTNRSLLVPNFL